MPFKKGKSGNPNGRPKGQPNKVNGATKEVLSEFVIGRMGKVQELWDALARVDEARAIQLWTALAEYVLPKQSRAELVGDKDAPLTVEIVKYQEED